MRCNRIVSAAATALLLAQAAHGQGFEQFQISPSVGTTTQRFGNSLAIDGDVLVAGAPYDDTKAYDAGAAYVYRFDPTTSTWNMEQQLFPADPEASSRFGSSVAVSGGVLAVGCPLEDNGKGTDAGSVYVFRYSSGSKTWSQEQKLIASVGAAYDQFGATVALNGNVLVAGAPLSDTSKGTDSGSAFVFRYQNSFVKWVEEKQLIDPNGAASDHAGTALSFDGTTIAIGSPYHTIGSAYNAGAVGAWTYNGAWNQDQEISVPTPIANDEFGFVVSVSADLIAVDAPLHNASSSIYYSGLVYLFRKVGSTWSQEAVLAPPAPAIYEEFGSSLAVKGSLVAIGSQYDDGSGKVDAGTAWTFRKGKLGGWVADQLLGASDAASSDHFGVQVVMSDTTILCAADGNDTTAGTDWGVVYGFPSAEMNMTITPSAPPPDTLTTISGFYGTPGDPCMITIEDANGTPCFIPVLIFGFAADHTLTIAPNSPSTHYGLSLGFRAYKISSTGPIVRSPLTYLDI